jgi:hypothetical protein
VGPFTQKNHDDLFVRISAIRESPLLVFRKIRQLFLELLASIGIDDIDFNKKNGTSLDLWSLIPLYGEFHPRAAARISSAGARPCEGGTVP